MDVRHFASQADLRAWLEENHDKAKEVYVGYYKVGSGRQSITYKESVDEALCFGWIDGVRKGIDDVSYTIRFTPRKPKSIWSDVNLKRVAELTEQGKMHRAGLTVFETRDLSKERQYSFEQPEEALKFSAAQEQALRANEAAWNNFQKMPPSYVKAAIWWVISAKQDATREKRLDDLIENSARGLKVPPLRRATDKQG